MENKINSIQYGHHICDILTCEDINIGFDGNNAREVTLSGDGSVVAVIVDSNESMGNPSLACDGVPGENSCYIVDERGIGFEGCANSALILGWDGGSWCYTGEDYSWGCCGFKGRVQIYKKIWDTWIQLGKGIEIEIANSFNDIDQYWIWNSGETLSLSSDGSIIAIGNPYSYGGRGVVRIYKNENNIWDQIGEDIVGPPLIADGVGDTIWESYTLTGWSVSLSSDGSIVAIGSPGRYYEGNVKIYKNENNSWIQIGQDIVGDLGFVRGWVLSELTGFSVSLSSNGSIVAVGSPNANNFSGHVRIYKNDNDSWIQIGNDINGFIGSNDRSKADIQWSVSLSDDGSTVAVGAPTYDGNLRIYKNISDSWIQIGEDIIVGGPSNSGWSVSLSGDGSTVAIGAPNDSDNRGSVRILKNINSVWTKIWDDMTGETPDSLTGYSVSLSGDGEILAIGSLGSGIGNSSVRIVTTPLHHKVVTPYCEENEYLMNGTCLSCPDGMINDAGSYTSCRWYDKIQPPCGTNKHFDENAGYYIEGINGIIQDDRDPITGKMADDGTWEPNRYYPHGDVTSKPCQWWSSCPGGPWGQDLWDSVTNSWLDGASFLCTVGCPTGPITYTTNYIIAHTCAKLRFEYKNDSGSTVYEMPNKEALDSCDFTDAILKCDENSGDPHCDIHYEANDQKKIYYYASKKGCEDGQKAAVNVVEDFSTQYEQCYGSGFRSNRIMNGDCGFQVKPSSLIDPCHTAFFAGCMDNSPDDLSCAPSGAELEENIAAGSYVNKGWCVPKSEQL